MPFEKTSVLVLFVPTTDTDPLNGWFVLVEPDSARIVVTLLVLVRAGRPRPRLVRVMAAAAVVPKSTPFTIVRLVLDAYQTTDPFL